MNQVGTSGSPLIELRGVQKHFGGVQAVRGVDFVVPAGTVTGLAGENGAGKSTLLKILAGLHQPDAGEVWYYGELQSGLTPAAAKKAGVAYVAQELSLFEDLPVSENILIGQEPMWGPLVNRRRLREEAKHALDTVGSLVDPDVMVRDLAFADRQLVEIAKAMVGSPRVLVLDEPTSGLRQAEVSRLIELMKELRTTGCSVVFITHRMGEFFEACDRMTILRDGAHIATVDIEDITPGQVVDLMIGRQLAEVFPEKQDSEPDGPRGDALVMKDFSVHGTRVHDMTLRLERGEVLGIAGLAGNGQTELLEGMAGVRMASGQYRVGEALGPFRSVRSALRAGVALVPEDRKRHGLVLAMTVHQNLTLPVLRGLSRWGFIDRPREASMVTGVVSAVQITPPDPAVPVESMSGGNQQKVVIGKTLLAEPDVYLLSDPTRGIDVKTKFEIYSLVRKLAASGKAVVLVSTDLAEITSLCDRVLVMASGRVVAELRGDHINEREITRASFQAVAE
jgi:ABC-type sugar transport system ATPase subunit